MVAHKSQLSVPDFQLAGTRFVDRLKQMMRPHDMLKDIMRRHRIPVIVVSSHSTNGASVTLRALSLGAFDFVAKPTDVSSRMQEIARDLIGKIKAAAQSR